MDPREFEKLGVFYLDGVPGIAIDPKGDLDDLLLEADPLSEP